MECSFKQNISSECDLGLNLGGDRRAVAPSFFSFKFSIMTYHAHHVVESLNMNNKKLHISLTNGNSHPRQLNKSIFPLKYMYVTWGQLWIYWLEV